MTEKTLTQKLMLDARDDLERRGYKLSHGAAFIDDVVLCVVTLPSPRVIAKVLTTVEAVDFYNAEIGNQWEIYRK